MIQQSQKYPHPLRAWCLWTPVATLFEMLCRSELEVLLMITVLVPDVILSCLPEELRGGS